MVIQISQTNQETVKSTNHVFQIFSASVICLPLYDQLIISSFLIPALLSLFNNIAILSFVSIRLHFCFKSMINPANFVLLFVFIFLFNFLYSGFLTLIYCFFFYCKSRLAVWTIIASTAIHIFIMFVCSEIPFLPQEWVVLFSLTATSFFVARNITDEEKYTFFKYIVINTLIVLFQYGMIYAYKDYLQIIYYNYVCRIN